MENLLPANLKEPLMKIRELINQLLNEDLDMEITIQCYAPYYEDAMDVDGIMRHPSCPNKIMILPEDNMVQSATID